MTSTKSGLSLVEITMTLTEQSLYIKYFLLNQFIEEKNKVEGKKKED